MTDPTPRSLPERPNLVHLKRQAKDKLAQLRERDATTTLADAQLAIARQYGFPSWRALKASVDASHDELLRPLHEAVENNDTAALSSLLDKHPWLVNARSVQPDRTALHLAATKGHRQAVDMLLARGADHSVRDGPDNACALHFAAQLGDIAVVKCLVESGADVHGVGDAHGLGVIGWATCFDTVQTDTANYLLSHGAVHHIFSAIAMDDTEALKRVVAQDPSSVTRIMSRWENHRFPLHLAVLKKHHHMIDLLVELGANLNATDATGRTAVELANLQEDDEAIRRLTALGAKASTTEGPSAAFEGMTPIFNVKDVRASIDYYVNKLGFKKDWDWGDPPGFASVSRGQVCIFLCQDAQGGVGTWLSVFVDNVDALHKEYKNSGAIVRQPPTNFPWGMREMNVEDLDGHRLRMGCGTSEAPDDVALLED